VLVLKFTDAYPHGSSLAEAPARATFVLGWHDPSHKEFAPSPHLPPKKGPRWGQQAEKEFRLGRGLGAQLVTEEEWKEHQRKMGSLTGEERERYR